MRKGKGELLKKSKEQIAASQKAKAEAKRLEFVYQKLLEEYQPQIDNLSWQADALAERFKDLYRSSKEAFEEGDGATAKKLSIDGRTLQQECEALNAQANEKRTELKEILEKVKYLKERASDLQNSADEQRKEAAAFRNTRVCDFDNGVALTNEEVECFLDSFSQEIFGQVKTIECVTDLVWEGKSGDAKVASRGKTTWDKTNCVTVEINGSGKFSKEDIKATIAHEIGHVVYEHFMTDEQKANWYAYHTEDLEKEDFISFEAIPNEEEDFAECYRIFKLEPKLLQEHDLRRYHIINRKIRYEKT